jgi:pyruvate kinase
MSDRKTKIVCTIGPASRNKKTIRELVRAGMNMARINLSHGKIEEHARDINTIRQVSKELGIPVPILLDLQGPKIRVGDLENGSVILKKGKEFTITTRNIGKGRDNIVSTVYKNLHKDVKKGDSILLDDGIMKLKVKKIKGRDVVCQVIDGGVLKPHKGINLPGVDVSVSSMTKKDFEDLKFGIDKGVDYIGVSFVRRAKDIKEVKRVMSKKGKYVPIIAKLEKPEVLDDIDEILKEVDGVMVARGDLGVEMSLEMVPVAQKGIIQKANRARVPVIVATQMLESMTNSPRPTRAEVSDVANAIFDDTDAVMLSGETAVGKYPVETVKMMSSIATVAEKNASQSFIFRRRTEERGVLTQPDAVCNAAFVAAHEIKAKAIVTFTQSGYTALLMSKYRPNIPIIAYTPHEETRRRINLYWGVMPKIMRPIEGTDELIMELEKSLISDRIAKKGDTLLILLGWPLYVKGTTNLMKIHKIEGN